MWFRVSEGFSSEIVKTATILVTGLSIGFYNGCNYGENKRNKQIAKENIMVQKGEPYVMLYRKEDNKFYLVQHNNMLEINKLNLEGILRKENEK